MHGILAQRRGVARASNCSIGEVTRLPTEFMVRFKMQFHQKERITAWRSFEGIVLSVILVLALKLDQRKVNVLSSNELPVFFGHSFPSHLHAGKSHQSFSACPATEVVQHEDGICAELLVSYKQLQTDPLFRCLQHTPCLIVHLNEAIVVIRCILISLEKAENFFHPCVIGQALHTN